MLHDYLVYCGWTFSAFVVFGMPTWFARPRREPSRVVYIGRPSNRR